jgi:uncharacterized membrane protein
LGVVDSSYEIGITGALRGELMKGSMIAGVLLIVGGVFALAYQGISYTRTKKAVDLGPIQVTTKEKQEIPLPPIIGGVALIGGLVLVFGNTRKPA